jgi:Zn-dependent protease
MGSPSERLQLLCLELVPFILAIVAHEYGHARMALYWGDSTAQREGRLTLNPIAHIDPLGSLLFPILNFWFGLRLLGWAKPVPIRPSQFRNYRRGLFWVSIAGPGMNILLALLSAAVLGALVIGLPQDFFLRAPLLGMALESIYINYGLAFFNLLPMPPLDGSGIIHSLLPKKWEAAWMRSERFFSFLLFVAVLLGGFSFLGIPIQFCARHTLRGVDLVLTQILPKIG